MYCSQALGGPFVRQEQQERLVSLAAKAAVENDPKKFRGLLLELQKLLSESERVRPIRGNGKSLPQPPPNRFNK
jgi:hypothetical protein